MKKYQSLVIANYIIETKCTIRQAARRFSVSKSTVHYYIHHYLKAFHPGKYSEVKEILDYNFAVKHYRGGNSTREKWKYIRNELIRKTV